MHKQHRKDGVDAYVRYYFTFSANDTYCENFYYEETKESASKCIFTGYSPSLTYDDSLHNMTIEAYDGSTPVAKLQMIFSVDSGEMQFSKAQNYSDVTASGTLVESPVYGVV